MPRGLAFILWSAPLRVPQMQRLNSGLVSESGRWHFALLLKKRRHFHLQFLPITLFLLIATTVRLVLLKQTIRVLLILDLHIMDQLLKLLLIFLHCQQAHKLYGSITKILAYLDHITLIYWPIVVNTKGALDCVTIRKPQFLMENGSSTIFFAGLDFITALGQFEALVSFAHQVRKQPTVFIVLRLLGKWRAVGKDIRLRRMPMHVQEQFDLLRLLAPALLEVFQDACQLWKDVTSNRILVRIPIPIEVVPQQASPVVAQHDPINIDHGNNQPTVRTIGTLQLLDETFHQPRPHSLPRMLTRNGDTNPLTVTQIPNDKSPNRMAKYRPPHLNTLEPQPLYILSQPRISIRRLIAKLDLIMEMLKNILKLNRVRQVLILIALLLKDNTRTNLLVVGILILGRLRIGLQTLAIQQATLNEVFNDQGHFSNLLVFHPEVEPLVVAPGVAVCPHVQLVLVATSLDYVLEVAALEVGLELDVALVSRCLSCYVVVYYAVAVLLHECAGCLRDQLGVEQRR